jgi:predicted RNA-binding protein with PUA-like domain
MNWLFKEEPEHYNFDALVKDARTVWSGVKNPVAQRHLHASTRGDRILYYTRARRRRSSASRRRLETATRIPATRPASTQWSR